MAEQVLLDAVTVDSDSGSAESFDGGVATIRVEIANPMGSERFYVGHKATGSSLDYAFVEILPSDRDKGLNLELSGATDVIGRVRGIQPGNSTSVSMSMNS